MRCNGKNTHIEQVMVRLPVRFYTICSHIVQNSLNLREKSFMCTSFKQIIIKHKTWLNTVLLHIPTQSQAVDKVSSFGFFGHLELISGYCTLVVSALEGVVWSE